MRIPSSIGALIIILASVTLDGCATTQNVRDTQVFPVYAAKRFDHLCTQSYTHQHFAMQVLNEQTQTAIVELTCP